MKCFFIYNPNSGNSRVIKKREYIINSLKKIYEIVDVYESKSANDMKEATKKACEIYDVIVFSGGDGTFNNVTCGVAGCKRRPILGYIPTGTGNDVARNLKIPLNVRKAIKVIADGAVIKHDVGMINNQYFMYVAGIGACTGTSYTTNQQTKKNIGRLAYARDGINEFFTTPLSQVTLISKDKYIETTAPLVLVLNTESVGRLPFNRYGYLNDGYFDVILVNNGPTSGRWNILKLFILGMFGFRRHKSYAIDLRSSEFEIKVAGENHIWCVDGERGPVGDVRIKNIHNHLTILVPKRRLKVKKDRSRKNV